MNKTNLHWMAGTALLLSGCGSLYSYYGLNDAATLQVDGKITSMDADTRSRQASVFYIKPGSRVIGLQAKSPAASKKILILEAKPKRHYRVTYQSSSQGGQWAVSTKGNEDDARFRWCDKSLSCKANEPFDVCVRRHCP